MDSVWNDLPPQLLQEWTTHSADVAGLLRDAIEADPSLLPVPPTFDHADRENLRAICDDALSPGEHRAAIERGLWSRWWALSGALRESLHHADLHSAAGVLRAWDEQIDVLCNTSDLVCRDDTSDTDLRSVAAFVLSRGDETRAAPDGFKFPSRLSPSRDALNGLVHPNHLGHLSVLDPQQPDAIRHLLQFAAELGRRAHDLPVHQPVAPLPPLGSVKLTGAAVADLVEEVLNIVDHLKARSPRIVEARAAIRAYRESFDRPDLTDPRGTEPSELEFYKARWAVADRQPSAPVEHPVAQLTALHAPFLLHKAETALATWQSAVQDRNLRVTYLEALANAAHATLTLRTEYHTEALVRAIVGANPILIALTARSVIEQEAATGAAMQISHARWDKLRGTGRIDRTFEKVEVPLLRVLTSGRHNTASTPLIERANELQARSAGSLIESLRTHFAYESGAEQVWNTLSAIVHGDNGALNRPGLNANAGIVSIGVIVLADATALSTSIRRSSSTVTMVQAISALARSFERGEDPRSEVQMQRVPEEMVPGEHFIGSGTRSDPYELLVGTGVAGFAPLIRHLGIGEHRRWSDMVSDGRIADRVETPAQTIYIVHRNAAYTN